MTNKSLLQALLILLGFSLQAQQFILTDIGKLKHSIDECSGLAVLPSGNIAMINDSGNDPELFICDFSGKIVKKIDLPKVENIDWEDLSYANGYLYIGDIGNNKNKRENLSIYKYKVRENDEVKLEGIISFSYQNQIEFPPADVSKNFDAEALITVGDSLFIFTKNRTKPFSGYTYVYGMSNQPGSYTLSPLDSFKTGIGERDYYWVSGAAYQSSSNTLVLLGYDKVWFFYDFKGTDFFGGAHKVFQMKNLMQKESIDFVNENTLIITDEENSYGGGLIYQAHFSLKPANQPINVKNKTIEDTLTFNYHQKLMQPLLWEIFNTEGGSMAVGNFKSTDTSGTYQIDVSKLPPGGYILHLIFNGQSKAYKLKKLMLLKPY